MNIAKLINELSQKKIFLSVSNDKLKIKAPEGALTSELLTALKKEKEQIISFVKSNTSYLEGTTDSITVYPRDVDFPLSISQKRLWYLYQLEGPSTTYTISGALRLKGSLNVEAIRAVFKTIVERHEALRTLFVEKDGEPYQVIQTAEAYESEVIDLQSIPKGKLEQKIKELIKEHTETPVLIDKEYMLKIKLLIANEFEHVLLWKMHHIASDGTSIGVLINEMTTLYRAYIKGLENPLPALTVQYPDFAKWQREWLKDDVLLKQLDYWKAKLKGSPNLHSLPLDKNRPAVQRFKGNHYRYQLDAGLTSKLNELSKQCNATLFMVMQAAFSIVLSRYSGANDIVIGTPIAGRTHAELNQLIGFFLNTLILRTDLSGNPKFSGLLEQVKKNTLEAYTHQHIPFEMLAKDVSQNDLSYSPVFQIMMVMQNYEKGELSLPGLTLVKERNRQEVAKFDITLSLVEFDDHIVVDWEFNIDLFTMQSITRMGMYLNNLLEAIVEEPNCDINKLISISEKEKAELFELSPPPIIKKTKKLLHQTISEQTKSAPECIAVVDGAIKLSYHQLNIAANQLASVLQDRNVGQGSRVGLCVDRGIGLAISVLAILKVGAAYVPLDPDYPEERLRYIIDDVTLECIVTQTAHQELFSSVSVASIVLDHSDICEELKLQPEENISLINEDDNTAAYVIYTSGSTGQPKGVVVSHANVQSYCEAVQLHYRISEQDTVLQFASYNFDAFIEEFFITLGVGGTLVLRTDEVLSGSLNFWKFIEHHCINVISLPTAFWQWLVDEFDADQANIACQSLRLCILGGEALNITKLSVWHHWVKDNIQLLNSYGPTEATVVATIADMTSVTDYSSAAPIGKPLANTTAYIVDDSLQLVPAGVAGELCLGGEGISCGYLDRPELTAEKFIEAEWAKGRLYRTGDRARWLGDGQLAYLGRNDDQVKVRGYRIELGEIESALVALPEVNDAVVLYDNALGNDQLVAYLVGQGQAKIPEVKEALQIRLPDYMVPSLYYFMEALPLTPNGKVDKKALPSIEEAQQVKQTYVEPVNDLEHDLCILWQNLLRLDQVGREDNFFELGGHSLLATRLVSAIRKKFEAELPLRVLFDKPTIKELADEISRGQSQEALLPPIKVIEQRKCLPLSYAQQRLWFLDRLEGGGIQYNMPFMIRRKKIEVDFLRKTLTALLERHESLRTCFKEVTGSVQQIIQAASDFPLTEIHLQNFHKSKQKQEVKRLAQEDASKPFNLSKDLMLRVTLLHLSEEVVMLFNIHHIASDGWSMNILRNEFQALYQAFSQGGNNPLKALKVQYADYAVWQRNWLQGTILEKEQKYWQQQLADIPQVHSFPLDKIRPVEQTYNGRSYGQRLNALATEKIHAFCQSQGITLFMFLQTVFSLLLGRYSQESDIVIGTPIAGRTHEDIEGLIGLFTNTLVLRTDLSGEPSFKGLLQRNKNMILGAYEHQNVPFEMLVESLQPKRSLSHSPIFQILFVLQNNEGVNKDYQVDEGLHSHRRRAIKFDLELTAVESSHGLSLTWTYNADLFLDDSIARLAQNLSTLIENTLKESDNSISRINILSSGERKRLLDFNFPGNDYPQEVFTHELFEAQVKNTPNAIAVKFEGSELTYQALNKNANQLARYLVDKGVKPESLVGLCFERSLDMMIAMMAILKAGAAYVPLDSGYPQARLKYILKDSNVELLITHSSLMQEFDCNECEKLILDADSVMNDLSECLDTNINVDELGLRSDHLMYVIYTSGSTGQPKGVQIQHSAFTNFIHAVKQKLPSLNRASRLLSVTTLAFDIFGLELWGALCHGAMTVIAGSHEVSNPKALQTLIDQHNINFMQATPATWYMLRDANWRGKSDLSILCGGEALSSELAKYLHEHCEQLWNCYGPTETTVYSLMNKLQGEMTKGVVPIGGSLNHYQHYVLDKANQIAPIGALGELHIAGPSLARGYLNQPELTSAKFIENPIVTGERLYKTGDLVRWLPNGDLEFLGRIDQQVKIRGFRIELSEIEYALENLDVVKDCVVVAEGRENKSLVAYVVLSEPSEYDFRLALSKSLPEYMLPTAYISLPSLPLTPNGKVDRKALPALEVGLLKKTYVAPRTLYEKRLCNIWQALLNVDPIGIEDNFFYLGGHSLLATRLISMIRQEFEVELPLKTLFDKPTIKALAPQILGADKDLLPAIDIVKDRERLPLSYAQRRLWFIDRLDCGSPQYNMPFMIRRKQINRDVLMQTLTALLERHETLRTNFSEIDGEAFQSIQPATNFPLIDIDLKELDEAEQKQEVKRLAEEDAIKSFNLSSDLMLRVSLLHLSDSVVMLFNLHHIASDGWSMNILRREFQALYEAFAQGIKSPLAPLKVQYADYALWQRNWLQGEVLQKQKQYWDKQLASIPQCHNLTLDKPRAIQQSYRGRYFGQRLNSTVAEKINAFCHQQDVTLFMFLQTSFALLLSRYSLEDDIVIGSPIAGRIHQDTEGLIGFFTNTLVLRTDLSGAPNFIALLHRNKDMILAAYEHQHIPFEMLVETLQPERSLRHSPIFQVLLTLQNNEGVNQDFLVDEGLLDTRTHSVKFELELNVVESSQGLSLTWAYNSDLFFDDSVARMSKNFSVLLESLLADSSKSVKEMNLLDPSEVKLLSSFNQTVSEYPQGKFIHELFEFQAGQTPDSIAVVLEDAQLSYQALNKQANQLAHYLIEQGVKPDSLVGICVERSLEMVVAMIATLKAGAAYVPLDPKYPLLRLKDILEDSKVKVLLTQSALLKQFSFSKCQLLSLNAPDIINDLAGYPTDNIHPKEIGLRSHHLAYVIYTSGSTGKPKGVLIEHHSMIEKVTSIAQVDGLSNQDSHLLFASISFDASVTQLFSSLVVGAQVVIRPSHITDGVDFMKYICRHKVTVIHIVPQYLDLLLDDEAELENGWKHSKLRSVICGGDVLSASLQQKWHNKSFSGIELYNSYGPTEATVTAATYHDDGNAVNGLSVPIGKATPNTVLYVMDEQLQLMPMGAAGELYIGGTGIARGYLNQAELTAEKFIQNPYTANERLYKTGDLVRWLPNGNLEFLERLDQQTKIRGFRIELSEIEHTLKMLDTVIDCVVVAEGKQDKRLIAYVVSSEPLETLEPNLREALSQRLPEYMLPSAYMVLPVLPQMPSGKIDRNALPAFSGKALQVMHVAPRNASEQLLCNIWQDLLKVEKVGIEDNFFYLGGHSLLATRLISAIRRDFKAELPLKALFDKPTIKELMAEVTKASGSNILPVIETVVDRTSLPLSYSQQRLWFIDHLESGSAQYNMPFMIRRERVNTVTLKQTLNALIERHESLRTCFNELNGKVYQLIQAATEFPLVEINLKDLTKPEQEQELARHAREDANKLFDLSRDLMLRVTLVHLSDEIVMLFNMHHIASDGWSMNILRNEFQTLYQAFSQGNDNPLAPLKVQYADYAVWQRNWLQGKVLEKQQQYWRKQLANIPHVHNLALDKTRPVEQTYRGKRYAQHLDASFSQNMHALCQQQDVTLFMYLQTAFALLLGRYSLEDDIVIGSPIAGRVHEDTEALIGFFVNTLVLRTDLSGNPSFKTLLQRNKDMILAAYEHQHISFEMLVESLQPERSLSYAPIFQVLFTMQNNEGGESSGRPREGFLDTVLQLVKFDIELDVSHSNNGLSLVWSYNTDLFLDDSIARLADNFSVLLKNLTGNPEQKINQISLLHADEANKILNNFNQTNADYVPVQCIHQLFESQVEHTPDTVAVIFDTKKLTYQELNDQANQLAHYLVEEKQAKPDTLIGICLERSLNMVVSLLATLKSGSAFLPLDPSHPEKRLRYMLEDSKVKVLLTHSYLSSGVTANDCEYLNLDDDDVKKILANCSKNNIDSATVGLQENNLAYVIYTSGSTGQPKGVQIEHASFINLIQGIPKHLPVLNYSSRVLAVSTLSFDIAGFELMGTLCYGATVIVAAETAVTNPEALIGLVNHHDINFMQATPATWQMLKDANWTGKTDLNVLSGGEAMPLSLAAYLTSQCGRVWNGYGPTEATVYTLMRELPDNLTSSSVPLGSPLGNYRHYVLDQAGQLAPIGALGELHISGLGLARAYLNQPNLTSEKFIANPFNNEDSLKNNLRLYKTGDLVRWLSNGDIEYCGRIDEQVKIHGFRIELGEVENITSSLLGVKQAVVIAHQDQLGYKYLTAYITLETAHSEQLNDEESKNNRIASYKQQLEKNLPHYMVPRHIILLNVLPLTPNGKIDKRALPKPQTSDLQRDKYIAPRNENEQSLCEIWQSLLSLEQVGVEDNFFHLGGHSLLTVQLVNAINTQLSTHLNVSQVFENPVLKDMATLVDRSRPLAAWQPLDNSHYDLPAVYCIPGAGMNAASLHYLSKSLKNRFAPRVFESKGLDGRGEPHTSMEALLDCYLSAIQTEQVQGPYRLLGHSFGGCIAYELALRLEQQGHNVQLILLDSYLDFTNTTGSDQRLRQLRQFVLKVLSMNGIIKPDGIDKIDRKDLASWSAKLLQTQNSSSKVNYYKMMQGLVDTYWAHTNMNAHYQPSGRLMNKVTLLYAKEGGMSEQSLLNDVLSHYNSLTADEVRVLAVEGDHFTMLEQENASALASIVSSQYYL